MQHIVLTEEQARILAEATENVEVRDPKGQVVSFLPRFDPFDVEAILRHRERKKRGPSGPGIPSARVQAMLRRAHEIAEREGMTPEKMEELLRRTQSGEES